jgi:hypothetical protein
LLGVWRVPSGLEEMKILITLKDPDGVSNSLDDCARGHVQDPANMEDFKASLEDDIKKWVRWGEYVSIVIDTDKGTATVVPVE